MRHETNIRWQKERKVVAGWKDLQWYEKGFNRNIGLKIPETKWGRCQRTCKDGNTWGEVNLKSPTTEGERLLLTHKAEKHWGELVECCYWHTRLELLEEGLLVVNDAFTAWGEWGRLLQPYKAGWTWLLALCVTMYMSLGTKIL